MKKGFTLIELLVVVLIIGILSSVALPQYQKAVTKAKAAEAWTLAKSIINAQKVYYMENGRYADNLDDLSIEVPTELKNWTLGISSPSVFFFRGKNQLNGLSLFVDMQSREKPFMTCYNHKLCGIALPCGNSKEYSRWEDHGSGATLYSAHSCTLE